jgi:hypothetical protein
MAVNSNRITFATEGNSTYVYGHRYGGMDRIALVSDTGEVEWIA